MAAGGLKEEGWRGQGLSRLPEKGIGDQWMGVHAFVRERQQQQEHKQSKGRGDGSRLGMAQG